jgi:hypothetical protein
LQSTNRSSTPTPEQEKADIHNIVAIRVHVISPSNNVYTPVDNPICCGEAIFYRLNQSVDTHVQVICSRVRVNAPPGQVKSTARRLVCSTFWSVCSGFRPNRTAIRAIYTVFIPVTSAKNSFDTPENLFDRANRPKTMHENVFETRVIAFTPRVAAIHVNNYKFFATKMRIR